MRKSYAEWKLQDRRLQSMRVYRDDEIFFNLLRLVVESSTRHQLFTNMKRNSTIWDLIRYNVVYRGVVFFFGCDLTLEITNGGNFV